MAEPVGPPTTTTDQWGQKVTTTPMSDGTLQVATQVGGSDGGDRPWTKTETVKNPNWQDPLVQMYQDQANSQPQKPPQAGIQDQQAALNGSNKPGQTLPSGITVPQVDKPNLPGPKPNSGLGSDPKDGRGLFDGRGAIPVGDTTVEVNEFGQRITRTPQIDGSVIVVTEGGGSDGADKPWIRTEIIPSGGSVPTSVDYTVNGVTIGLRHNPDGTTDRVLNRHGIIGIQTSGGGDEGAHQPWTRTVEIDPSDPLAVTSILQTRGNTYVVHDDGHGLINTNEHLGDGTNIGIVEHDDINGNPLWKDITKSGLNQKTTHTHIEGKNTSVYNDHGDLIQKIETKSDGSQTTTNYPAGISEKDYPGGVKPDVTTKITKHPDGTIDYSVLLGDVPVTGAQVNPNREDPDLNPLDWLKHDGQTLSALWNNLVVAPVKHNFGPLLGLGRPDGTSDAGGWTIPYAPPQDELEPWPSASDLLWTAVDLSADGMLARDLMRGLVNRVGVAMAARDAYRAAKALGATEEAATAASSAAIQDYVVSHQIGDAVYEQALKNGMSPEAALALRNQTIDEVVGGQKTANDGLGVTATQGDGVVPQIHAGPNSELGSNSAEHSAPGEIGISPNSPHRNPSPLSPYLQQLDRDLGIDSQSIIDAFVAENMVRLNADLTAIESRTPVLAGVVNGIRDGIQGTADALGLGGTEARSAGGATHEGGLGSGGRDGSGGGGGALPPGGRDPGLPGSGEGGPHGGGSEPRVPYTGPSEEAPYGVLPQGIKINTKGQWYDPSYTPPRPVKMPAWATSPAKDYARALPVRRSDLDFTLSSNAQRDMDFVTGAKADAAKTADSLREQRDWAAQDLGIDPKDLTRSYMDEHSAGLIEAHGTDAVDKLEAAMSRYNIADNVVTQLTGEMGMIAARDYIRQMGGTVITGLEGSMAGSGTFDVVGLVNGRLVVVEAKGGGATLGSRWVEGDVPGQLVRVQQGTKQYLDWMLKNDPDLRAALTERGLLQDVIDGTIPIDYDLVKMNPRNGGPQVYQFDVKNPADVPPGAIREPHVDQSSTGNADDVEPHAEDIAAPLSPVGSIIGSITHAGSLIGGSLIGFWGNLTNPNMASTSFSQLNSALARLSQENVQRAENVDQALTLHISAGQSPEDYRVQQDGRKVLAYMPGR